MAETKKRPIFRLQLSSGHYAFPQLPWTLFNNGEVLMLTEDVLMAAIQTYDGEISSEADWFQVLWAVQKSRNEGKKQGVAEAAGILTRAHENLGQAARQLMGETPMDTPKRAAPTGRRAFAENQWAFEKVIYRKEPYQTE